MMANFKPKAILLDFYGTVVAEDTTVIERVCDQVNESVPTPEGRQGIAKAWGRVFIRLCASHFGNRFHSQRDLEIESLRLVLREYGCPLDPVALSQPLFEYWTAPEIYPESKSVLDRCPLPICLVSNIDNPDLQLAVSRHSLRFDHIVTSQDCRAYKPRAEVFGRALAGLDLLAHEVMHVGDSLSSDIKGAREAGIASLWVNRNKRTAPFDCQPTCVTGDLSGILPFASA